MKKTVTFILITCFLFICSTSLIGQTTLEEYNYITKGYKVQIESGLDMKKGYEFADIGKYSTSARGAELKILYRVKDSKEIAAYMVMYKRESITDEYICIPHPNSDKEILDKYWTTLYNGGFNDQTARLQIILFLISKHLNW